MTELITFTVVGLAIGSIYSIASVGLVVTYTTSGILISHTAQSACSPHSFTGSYVGILLGEVNGQHR